MLGIVRATGSAVVEESRLLPSDDDSVVRSVDLFELRRDGVSAKNCFYRVNYGTLEWSYDLADLVGYGAQAEMSSGDLLGFMQGHAPPPDHAPVAGVRRLAPGTTVRVAASGVAVTAGPLKLADAPVKLNQAVARSLADRDNDFGVAYSGGLGSAYVALCAREAGFKVLLFHADLNIPSLKQPLPQIPGQLSVLRVDVDELLDYRSNPPGSLPKLPDLEVPRRLMARLGDRAGLPLVGGSFMKDLVSIKLHEVNVGKGGRRLLECEPFHVFGTLNTLAEARSMLKSKAVYAAGPSNSNDRWSELDRSRTPPPPSPSGNSRVPWLTSEGQEFLETTQRGLMAVWQACLDEQEPRVGKLLAGLEERGDASMYLPAMDTRVLAAVSSLENSRLGRIKNGKFENCLPLRDALSRVGISATRQTAAAYWLRLSAADYLTRNREALIAELRKSFVLADRGLLNPQTVLNVLGDGRGIADYGMALLRLAWLEAWLRAGR